MNITPQVSHVPLATVFNPQTDNLRRENNLREVIAQPAAVSQSAAEKGVASDRDKAKSTSQHNEELDFVALQKKAEQASKTINEQSGQQGEHSGEQKQQQNGSQSDQVDEQQTQSEQEPAQHKATEPKDDSEQAKQQKASAEQQAEQQHIRQLKARDKEVKAHEPAHAAVGGSTTGAPSYSFEQGPDGIRYAVDGEVSVDLSPVAGNPTATIAKMQQVHAAALAPVNPSSQDKSVAAHATELIAQAQAELLQIKQQSVTADVSIKQAFHDESVVELGDKPTVERLNTENKDLTSDEFDLFINKTLQAQEQISPTVSNEITQRAARIELFYMKISQAYERPSNHNFQLTA
jgi:hypothetical protein